MTDIQFLRYHCSQVKKPKMSINKVHSIMMGATSGAGTAYPSGAPEFTPGFLGVCVAQYLVFCEL